MSDRSVRMHSDQLQLRRSLGSMLRVHPARYCKNLLEIDSGEAGPAF